MRSCWACWSGAPDWPPPLNYAIAFAAYLAADLATGSTLAKTAWLTAGNLAGVIVGQILFMQLQPEDRALARPESMVPPLIPPLR